MNRPPDGSDITIDRRLPTPIHKQISDAIRRFIATGAWAPHHRLENEPEFAQKIGVSRDTYRRAIATLEAEGLLRQVRGRGTFVAQTPLEPSVVSKLTTLSEYFEAVGEAVSTEVVLQKLVIPPQPVAALLSMPRQTPVLELHRIRSTSAGRFAYLKNYVRSDLAPNLHLTDFSQSSLFAVLENQFELSIHSARRTFSAVPASTEVADHLNIAVGDPVQYLEQITYLEDGSPIEYSDVWIRSSLMRLSSVLLRG